MFIFMGRNTGTMHLNDSEMEKWMKNNTKV